MQVALSTLDAATHQSDERPEKDVTFVDAFAIPRVAYDAVRRTLHRCDSLALRCCSNMFVRLPATASLLGPPDSKVALSRERLYILSQRLSRNRLFSRPALGTGEARCELTPLTSLLGAHGSTHFVLGALSQLEDGRFWLEDDAGRVAVDLSEAVTAAGLFTDNAVVIAEGELRRDGVFQVRCCCCGALSQNSLPLSLGFKVRALGFPPLEPRVEARAAFAGLDMFGAGALQCVCTTRARSGFSRSLSSRPEDVARLDSRACSLSSEMWVVLSDVWADAPKALSRLRLVLSAFEAAPSPPQLFVLMGDFCSVPFGSSTPSVERARGAGRA